ncbi:flagellar protein FliT [Pseudomonas sp. Choline-3u-10]|jgi:flagellar protein FliT|uniref:flagellar protein FliT n=1 Tax=Pseudomonadaceae TaxID=135621 RepID=UPI000617DFC9|nr:MULTISPECIES: flagellar protein FliT [Pseudomonadaceae]MAL35783.1 flagellar protein FliT [Pseudomonas sp.]MBU0950058.1 flagellar protein FliT [Gammaproteobacteria bacterium]KJJ64869.1 flagellar assembly protein FliT [Pseudomonas sp. 10B238]MBK3795969.1 flagellar protein FliT [Stutzerimonas stutzeri]MBK3877676.1 flagellar protein FliT [Stutzerimonas stutzeri]
MSSPKQAFVLLTKKLRDAFAASDWEAIALLDEECRALVSALGESDAADAALREQLAELSHVYGELQQAGRAERDRLAGELTRLSQSKQVNQAYKALGQSR